MFLPLLSSRRFAPLFWCQFCSALNDNFFKNALGMLILFGIGGSGAAAPERAAMLLTLSGVAFIAPFFLFSALGGELADRFDKARVARSIRLAEIPVAALAAAGFLGHLLPLLIVALAGFGTIAALFGPVKYGLLPERLTPAELPASNALVEGATFLAILIGTIAGTAAVSTPYGAGLIIAVVLLLAAAAFLAAAAIPAAAPAAPDLVVTANPWTSTRALLSELRADRRSATGAHIVAFFWLVGFLVLALLPVLAKDNFAGDQRLIALCLAAFTVGIAIGSGLAAAASRGQPNLALVPLGALLMGICALFVAGVAAGAAAGVGAGAPLLSLSVILLLAGLCALALAGGLFIVPSFAAVQAWAPVARRARVIAAVNVLSAAYMAAGGGVLAALQALGAGAPALFAALGLLSLLATALIIRAWGDEVLRGFARMLLRFLFRLEVAGEENIPHSGESVIYAPNHVSLLDGPILHSVLPQRAAFAVNTQIAQAWWVRPFLRFIPAHLLDPSKPLAARTLVTALREGASIVIFPEGRITVTGGLMKVYDGAAMVADRAGAAIVAVRIEGAERSPFSYLRPTQTRKILLPKIKVTFLPPRRLTIDAALKGKARRRAAALALQDMLVEAAVATARIDRSLFAALAEARMMRAARAHAVADALGTGLSYRQLIAAAQTLARKLALLAPTGAAVGIMLPNAANAVVTFFALNCIGCVAAMINYTAGAASIAASARAARVSVVLTSRAFIARARLQGLIGELQRSVAIVYLEDVREAISLRDRIGGVLAGSRPQIVRSGDDPAVILFTSGSEGAPKGVVLSSRNLLANCAQCLARVDVNGEDVVFNVLPLFHSFGLTGGLLLPLFSGVPVVLYPSPLHYRLVPELIYDTCATIMFATNTFLKGYARAAHAYDLRNVRLLIAGGEAVQEDTRRTYVDRFGVRILEGYGATETAPVLAMNTPIANRLGSVGRLSPLMQARLEPVAGIADGGRLLVKGPNVMVGYYRPENPGVLDPPPDGWHDTGDIVSIDAEGFISIKGRAKRFAKIAGEMISLAAIEALASEALPGAPLVVVAVPDQRKGERTVLVTSAASATREALQQVARRRGAPELMVPAEIIVVDRVPQLGSGKPDVAAATMLARARQGAPVPGGTVAA